GADVAGAAGRAVVGNRLQLRAAAALDLERPVVAGVVRDVDGQARDVRAPEQVGLVFTGVVATGRAVAVGEAAHDQRQVPVLAAAQLGPQQLNERLVDAQVGLE